MKKQAEMCTPLLQFLASMSPDSSKNSLKSWVEQGRVVVNGKLQRKCNYLVQKGDEVAIRPKTLLLEGKIKIVYEDKQIVVIEKPPGLLSVALDEGKVLSAHQILKWHYKAMLWPVHRLDRETSGVMMFALTKEAQAGLKKQFEKHSIKREYYALVEGKLDSQEGTWQSFLQENSSDYRMKSAPSGQKAITHYKVVSDNGSISLVLFTLETGRKNQIRVQAAEAGHPIVGDFKYGSRIRRFKRMCLHAASLGFIHPLSQKELFFRSPLPACFYT